MAQAPPILKLDRFPLQLAVWQNESKDGKPYKSITLKRRYKDEKTGEWKDSTNLFANELLVAAEMLRYAWTAIMEHEAEEKKSDRPSPSTPPTVLREDGQIPF